MRGFFKKKTDYKNDEDLSFFGHLEAFRKHLIRALISIVIFTLVAFLFKDIVFGQIILPPSKGDFISYKILCALARFIGINSDLCEMVLPFKLINTSMSGQFNTHIWVSIVVGLIVSFPYVFYEIWSFISPGLTAKERSTSRGVIFFTSLLFFVGVCFGYFLVSPLSIVFLGSYQVDISIENTIQLGSYINVLTSVVLAGGLLFQVPIVIYFLAINGLVSSKNLKKYRKHTIIVVLFVAAVITPPDIGSQIMVTIPIMGLYQVGIWLTKRIEKKASLK